MATRSLRIVAGLGTLGVLIVGVIAGAGAVAMLTPLRPLTAVQLPSLPPPDAPLASPASPAAFESDLPPADPVLALPPEDANAAGVELQPPPADPAPGAIAPARSPMLDDPEGSAALFVERNRREAAEAVDALSAEVADLRERLAKAEAGLHRWKGILDAINQGDEAGRVTSSPAGSSVLVTPNVDESTPLELHAIPAAEPVVIESEKP